MKRALQGRLAKANRVLFTLDLMMSRKALHIMPVPTKAWADRPVELISPTKSRAEVGPHWCQPRHRRNPNT